MTGSHTLTQAVEAVKQGSLDEAALLIHIALKDPDLQHGSLRALAYYTLAKTTKDRATQINYLEQAIQADPGGDGSERAKRELSRLLADDLTLALEETFDTQEQHIVESATTQVEQNKKALELESMRTVGIHGVQSGTGFFISEDGYIATTRHLTRGLDKVNVDITKYGIFEGKVVYANVQIDLAIIKLDIIQKQLFPITKLNYIPENTVFTAHPYQGRILQGTYRPTKRNIGGEWIPTTFTQLVDGGGNPMFNEQQHLIGMLTHNSGRSSNHVYGLHIHKILDELQWYLKAIQSRPELVYCNHCGELSRARSLGAYYCEKCGGVLNHARDINRLPSKHSALYEEDIYRKCAYCQSQIGYHEGKCLRCGQLML